VGISDFLNLLSGWGACPQPLPGDCCTGSGGAGCDDAPCQASVCASNPSCCSVAWDELCADQAELDLNCACKTSENEPNCGLDGAGMPDDTTNGGCNAVPPVFQPISCGQGFAGTAAYDDVTGFRDTDWYEVTLTEPMELTWTVAAQFEALAGIIDSDGSGSCEGVSAFLVSATGLSGETISVSACLPVGIWWVFVAPQFNAAVACGTGYNALLTCAPCDPIGGCCFPDGTCLTGTVVQCAQAGGVFQGGGTDCSGACPVTCGPGAGDCCISNGTPGCDDATCCESVCAADPFCCDSTWDQLCADQAAVDPNCACPLGPPVPAPAAPAPTTGNHRPTWNR